MRISGKIGFGFATWFVASISFYHSSGVAAHNSSPIRINGIPEYADSDEAIRDGLEWGSFFRTGELLKIVPTCDNEHIGDDGPPVSQVVLVDEVIFAQQITLSTERILCGFGVIVENANGQNMRFAVYDEIAGQPGDLISAGRLANYVVDGENSFTVNRPPDVLPAGNYWLAHRVSADLTIGTGTPSTQVFSVETPYVAAIDARFPTSWGAPPDAVYFNAAPYNVYLLVK